MLACRTPPIPQGSPDLVNSNEEDLGATTYQAVSFLVDNFFDKKKEDDNITASLSKDPDLDSVQQALFSLVDNFFDKKKEDDNIIASLSELANVSKLMNLDEQQQGKFTRSHLPKGNYQHSMQESKQGKKRKKVKEGLTQKNLKIKHTKVITETEQQIIEQPNTNTTPTSGDLIVKDSQRGIETQSTLGKKAYRKAIEWLKEAADCGHQQAINLLKEANSLEALEQNEGQSPPANRRLLPVNIWKNILSYLPPTSIGAARQVNHLFYLLTKKHIHTWAMNENIDFSQLKLNSFSHFQFQYLVRKVKNLPREFRPYLNGSHLQEIDLSFKLMGNIEIILFAQCLQGSNVHTIHLNLKQLHHTHLAMFTKALQSTKVNTIIISNCKNKEALKRLCPNINWL
jgi:hypothetical protein